MLPMPQPPPLQILSDDEDQESPLFPSKRRKTEDEFTSNLVIIDGTPTPRKPNPTLSYVPETPMSSNDLSILKCTSKLPDDPTPFLVPETPLSTDSFKSDFSVLKCTDIRSLLASAFDDAQNVAGTSNDFSTVKCTSKVTDPTPFLVPDTPMSSDAFKSDLSLSKCMSKLPDPKIQSLSSSAFDDAQNGAGTPNNFLIVRCTSKVTDPTPFLVPDTPMSSDPFKSDFSISKCTSKLPDPKIRSLSSSAFDDVQNDAEVSGSIYLESDNESIGGIMRKSLSEYEPIAPDYDISSTECEHMAPEFGVGILLNDVVKTAVRGECSTSNTNNKVHNNNEEENVTTKKVGDAMKQTDNCVKLVEEQGNSGDDMKVKKRKAKEEKSRLAEEKKLTREKERLEKKAMKEKAVEAKKLQKEQQKWEKGKFALKSIVAEIDSKVIELGSIGGHLLTRFAEKDISYRVTSNPIERSILWTMSVPEQLMELSSKGKEVRYVLLVYEAAEFCNLVINGSLMSHVSEVQSRHPSYTICYLTNRLMAYINKREHAQSKNQPNSTFWKRPPVEEVLSKLATDFVRVHSRQCRDEAEIADHLVGLTCALANCQFRKNLTRLSINANGAVVPKDFIDRSLIKKNIWLKALVAIPMVQPRFAIAIGKKYPTMKSLLDVYMDQSKSVHEKEFVLENLATEGLLGQEDRRVGPVCSKRVYRILMAQSGHIKTDDVELGADFFTNQAL